MGINKNEERRIMKEHDIDPGWGKRRSHQGFQPICAIGFQHALDIMFDWHTTYPPDRGSQKKRWSSWIESSDESLRPEDTIQMS